MLTTIEVLWSQRDVRLLLVLSAVVAVVVAARRAARGRAWIAPAALTFVCGLILSVTLNPGFGLDGDPAGQLRHCWRGLSSAPVVREAFMSPGGVSNVLLFVPFGALAYAVSSRAVVAVAGSGAFSLGVELTQVFLVSRDCSSVDWLSNVTGGVTGTVVGVVAVGLRRTPAAKRRVGQTAGPPM